MSAFVLVALSLAVLLVAPLVAHVLAKRPALVALLDTFVLVAVGGIVVLDVVPQSIERAGPVALGAAVVGLFLPIVLHRVDEQIKSGSGRAARDLVLLVAFLGGTFIHALFDGVALAGVSIRPELALGVLLHRLPVGLALWIIVRPKLGIPRTLLVVGALTGGTLTGALVGEGAIAGASAPVLAIVQAFVAGSILHIVAEAPPFAATGSSWWSRAAVLAGTALAVAALVAVHELHGDEHAAGGAALDTLTAFVTLALHTAPAVLLSFLLVGALTALYSPGAPPLPERSSRVVNAAVGVAAGLPHPLCSCTVAPLYTRLVERGASPAGARAFLVATPELGVPAILLSARLFGLPFTGLRVVGAALLAWLVGAAAVDRARASTGSTHDEAEPLPPLLERLRHGMRHALFDAVDHVGPWILTGLAVAALLEPALDEDALASVPAALQTIAFAVLSLPLYLCAAGATPVAALLVHKGASVGAILALLLVGPATSMPTLALVRRLHGRASAVSFALVVVGGAAVLGIVADALFAGAPGDAAAGETAALLTAGGLVSLHALADAGPSALEVVSLVGVTALLVVSLARQGVRGFLVQVMSPQHGHHDDGAHVHGPGCFHDHGPPVAPAVPGIRMGDGGMPKGAARVTLSFDPRGPRPEPRPDDPDEKSEDRES